MGTVNKICLDKATVSGVKNCEECCHSFLRHAAESVRATCAAKCEEGPSASTDWMGFAWNAFITAMCVYFLASIVESLAKDYLLERTKADMKAASPVKQATRARSSSLHAQADEEEDEEDEEDEEEVMEEEEEEENKTPRERGSRTRSRARSLGPDETTAEEVVSSASSRRRRRRSRSPSRTASVAREMLTRRGYTPTPRPQE